MKPIRPEVETIYSFDSYALRYNVNPSDARVLDSFKKYILHKIERKETSTPGKVFEEAKAEIKSPNVSLTRLNYLSYISLVKSQSRQILRESLNWPEDSGFWIKRSPKFFAQAFLQIANPSFQWSLASSLRDNPEHLMETLKAHPCHQVEKQIEKMEKDLAGMQAQSPFKRYLMERGVLDSDGRLRKAETPLETRQSIECCLQLLSSLLEINLTNLKEADEALSSFVYGNFSAALDKNNNWKRQLSEIQSSTMSIPDKIAAITEKLSKANKVEFLKKALSFEVTEEDLTDAFESGPLSKLGFGIFWRDGVSFVEQWEAKTSLESLHKKGGEPLLSKVENLCRALGVNTPARCSVYDLYASYTYAFKECCANLSNPLQILLAKEAYMNHDDKILEQLRPKIPAPIEIPIQELTVDTTLSPVNSEATDRDVDTPEAIEFLKDLYPEEADVEAWTQQTREAVFDWLRNAPFAELLKGSLTDWATTSYIRVLAEFEWYVTLETKRLGLSIDVKDLKASVASGDLRNLKSIADVVAYARYSEVNSHEPKNFKGKSVSEKIKQTRKYLKTMPDRAEASYLLFCLETLPFDVETLSKKDQKYLDNCLKGSFPENGFYKYLQKNQLNALKVPVERRIGYLFYVQNKLVKELVEISEKPHNKSKGWDVLSLELRDLSCYLDITKLDVVSDLIENNALVDIDLCLSLNFNAGIRKIFIDGVLDGSFNAVANFEKIKDLTTQKSILNDLCNRRHHKVVSKITLKGDPSSYVIGYEWIRSKIGKVSQENFMLFFMKNFTQLSEQEITSEIQSLEATKKNKGVFQNLIKEERFVGSPVRSLLEQEGLIDSKGDFVSNEVFMKVELCLASQRDLIRLRLGQMQLEIPSVSSEGPGLVEWVNDQMRVLGEKGASLEFSIEDTRELMKAISENKLASPFSLYLGSLYVESIQGLSPRKLYECYHLYLHRLVEWFSRKAERFSLDTIVGKSMNIYVSGMQIASKNGDWDTSCFNAQSILLLESVTKEKLDFYAGDLRLFLENESKNLSSIMHQDIEKWKRKCKAEIDKSLLWAQSSVFSSFADPSIFNNLSLAEKHYKLQILMNSLALVLANEFDRLGMSASYKDMIESATYGTKDALWTLLVQEACYANYQDALAKASEIDASSLDVNSDELLGTKIEKLKVILKEKGFEDLFKALDSERLVELVRNKVTPKSENL